MSANKPQIGKWFKIAPEGARSSTGEQWYGHVRLGTVDGVVVFFYGGGVSVDQYTAAHPFGSSDAFYACSPEYDPAASSGITDCDPLNPFRNWTIVSVPYSTGDSHAGAGEYEYTDLDGNQRILYHYGYINYTLLMREAMKYIPRTKRLLVTGSSAGGFGAAILADDVITNYFPDVKNVTVLSDAGFIITDRWHEICENVWHAPKEIADRATGNNVTLDALTALYRKRGDGVKILFDCSRRDGTLLQFQAYFDGTRKKHTGERAVIFQGYLTEMVRSMRSDIPGSGIYIWSDPGEGDPNDITSHTILCSTDFYGRDHGYGTTVSRWLLDAIDGDVKSYGLELL